MIWLTSKKKMKAEIDRLETLHKISLETNKMITESKNNEIEKYEKLYQATARTNKAIIRHRNMRIEDLETINAKLNNKIIVNNRNLSNCFKINKQIANDLKEANLKILKLEKNNTSLSKKNEAYEKLLIKYKGISVMVHNVNVNVIRKLWANKEAQRQLRRLADNDEVNNIHKLRTMIRELAMLIGI